MLWFEILPIAYYWKFNQSSDSLQTFKRVLLVNEIKGATATILDQYFTKK